VLVILLKSSGKIEHWVENNGAEYKVSITMSLNLEERNHSTVDLKTGLLIELVVYLWLV
jgi:hypothetical protein